MTRADILFKKNGGSINVWLRLPLKTQGSLIIGNSL